MSKKQVKKPVIKKPAPKLIPAAPVAEAPAKPTLPQMLRGIRALILNGLFQGSHAELVMAACKTLDSLADSQEAGEAAAAVAAEAEVK